MVNGDNPSIYGKYWYVNIWLLTFDVKPDTSDVGSLLDAISREEVFSHLPSVMDSIGQFLSMIRFRINLITLDILMVDSMDVYPLKGTQTTSVNTIKF